jgi:hypothetical protein
MTWPFISLHEGKIEFGSDAEIFAEYVDPYNQMNNSDTFDEDSELGTGELEQGLAEVLV